MGFRNVDDETMLLVGLAMCGVLLLLGVIAAIVGAVRRVRWTRPAAAERRAVVPPWLLLRAMLTEPQRTWPLAEIASVAALPESVARLCLARLERAGWVDSQWDGDPGSTPRVRQYLLTADGLAHAREVAQPPGSRRLREFATALDGRHAYAHARLRARDFDFADQAADVLDQARRLVQLLRHTRNDADRRAEPTRDLNHEVRELAARVRLDADPRKRRFSRRTPEFAEPDLFAVAGLGNPLANLIAALAKTVFDEVHSPAEAMARATELALDREHAAEYLQACVSSSYYVLDQSGLDDIDHLIEALREVRDLHLAYRSEPPADARALPGRATRRLVDVGTRPLPPPGRTRYREEFARDLCERPRRYRLARACHLIVQARRLRSALAGPS